MNKKFTSLLELLTVPQLYMLNKEFNGKNSNDIYLKKELIQLLAHKYYTFNSQTKSYLISRIAEYLGHYDLCLSEHSLIN